MSTMSSIPGYLGIDNGTQGISVLFCNEALQVLATGEASYGMVSGLPEGCYEQLTSDWDTALVDAMNQVKQKLFPSTLQVLAIGISGQMHGQVLVGDSGGGDSLAPVRLWCDARNQEEATELTNLFDTKVPKRSTVARFLWTIRNQPELARSTRHITTPAGWIAYRLTGEVNLGIGDASGMFPIDQTTLDYDESMLQAFDDLVKSTTSQSALAPIKTLLPNVCKAGESAGVLSKAGSALLGLPAGIPVAAAEGDQPAALAGSLIGEAGMVSMSFGTSVVSNSVGDRAFLGVDKAVDQFCAPDGKPINMVWLRNGTTFLNTIIGTFRTAAESNSFDSIMPQVIQAAPDCGGLLALPFMDDEPGLNVHEGGTAMIVGLNGDNATPGNVAKAALLSTIFNLKLGSNVLEQQGYPRTEIVLSGGLTKTPQCGQIVADVFDTPVTLLESAEEGCAWGGALLAKFRHECKEDRSVRWSDFLKSIAVEGHRRFEPNPEAVHEYKAVYERYQKLMAVQPALNEAISK